MLVLNFHRIESPTGLEITRISPVRFTRFLDMIERSSLRVANAGTDPLDNNHQVLLTFDDGFDSVARNALPEFRRRGWTAVVFLIAGSIGKSDDWDVRLLGRRRPMMNWDDIRAWSGQGFEFGSHSLTHADLTALSEKALAAELAGSMRVIEDALGRPARFLSFPFGRHNARVREAAVAAGYEAAFATGGTLWDHGDPWMIPRVGITSLTSRLEFESMLRAVSMAERGEASPWRHRWPARVFEALNAGSATVGNWRRRWKLRSQVLDESEQAHAVNCAASNNHVTDATGLR